MGRQWLHAKRAIVNLKKGQTVGKLVKEITVAAKLGGGEIEANARLFAAVEKAKKAALIGKAAEKGDVVEQILTFLRTWGKGEFTLRTHGISVGPNGTIFCTDDGNQCTDNTCNNCKSSNDSINTTKNYIGKIFIFHRDILS